MKKLLILKRGDELLSKLTQFCQEQQIDSAWFNGLGAAESVNLAIYDIEKKKYHKKRVKGPLEIANLSGNIGKLDNKIIIHCHATLSNENMEAFAGHVEEMIIAGTCEIILSPLDIKIKRKYDPETGLNLIGN